VFVIVSLGGLLDWEMHMEGARGEVVVVSVECLVCIVDGSFVQLMWYKGRLCGAW
jgi:hypothetical protein